MKRVKRFGWMTVATSIMRSLLSLLILLAFLLGCSSADNPLAPDGVRELPYANTMQRLDWVWDCGLYRVSADHTSIERIPMRDSNIHVNVTKFVEPPNCIYCLQFSKPVAQPDGTLKVNVTLRHPFPGQPEFTGFDVRGTVIFPATRYWKGDVAGGLTWYTTDTELLPGFEDFVPFYFSRAEDGGGQLLNADGFTLYFFPGFHIPGWDLPVFEYNKGIYANGPDPDSTINGYKEFTNDPDRRMFLVTDEIIRTYHISPPEGEFIFGYVVDASWTWPTNMPVTDPKTDFPFWANCEDGYILDVEQINPFKLGTWGDSNHCDQPPFNHPERIVLSVTTQTPQTTELTQNMWVYVFCPDLTTDIFIQERGVALGQCSLELDKEKYIDQWFTDYREGTYDAVPGQYVALIIARPFDYIPGVTNWPRQILVPSFYQFIVLEVIAGD